jgi:hypothetical protein
MYCSSCGAAIAQSASYCNHCGTKTSAIERASGAQPAHSFTESLVWAMVTVFIVGLGCTIGLMAMMKQLLDFSNHWILSIALLTFLLTIMVEGVIVSMLRRQKKVLKKEDEARRLDARATRELDEAQPHALPEPVPSVTEHATRIFEPALRKQK